MIMAYWLKQNVLNEGFLVGHDLH